MFPHVESEIFQTTIKYYYPAISIQVPTESQVEMGETTVIAVYIGINGEFQLY